MGASSIGSHGPWGDSPHTTFHLKTLKGYLGSVVSVVRCLNLLSNLVNLQRRCLVSCRWQHMTALAFCEGTTKSLGWLERSRSRPFPAYSARERGVVSYRGQKLGTSCLRASPSFSGNSRQMRWAIKTMSDDSSDQSGNSNRLFGAIQSFFSKFFDKLKKARRGLPVKILFFLIGFYCATAFATVIGQTGDWDILSAGLAVAIVEGIGALMYKASLVFIGRIRNMISIFNYWKAGLTMGLFLDSFKYEVDECNPFNFEINIFTGLW